MRGDDIVHLTQSRPALEYPAQPIVIDGLSRYRQSGPRARLSAIVMPTSRPPDTGGAGFPLARDLAEREDAQLVILRSGAACREPFARELVPRTTQPTIVADLPEGAADAVFPELRNGAHVVATYPDRTSDLASKRNLGLLVGLLAGWDIVLMLDDDVTTRPASRRAATPGDETIDAWLRLDDVLAEFGANSVVQAIGYVPRDYDDNSAVGHARRLAGWAQDVFISGSALAIRCGKKLPFFPSSYNEDWLFVLLLVYHGSSMLPSPVVRRAGIIHQQAYNPFVPARARREELGDVLAEGLFKLLRDHPGALGEARGTDFWNEIVEERIDSIARLLVDLSRSDAHPAQGSVKDATETLRAALAVYDGPTRQWAERLGEYVRLLSADLDRWLDRLDDVKRGNAGDAREALIELGLGPYVTTVSPRWPVPPPVHGASGE